MKDCDPRFLLSVYAQPWPPCGASGIVMRETWFFINAVEKLQVGKSISTQAEFVDDPFS